MWKSALLLATFSANIYAATIQVVPVTPTPEPDHVRIEVLHPKENEVETNSKIRLQILIEGYGLGINSQFDRNKEIYNNSQVGQVMRVAIDNYPHFNTPTTSVDALDLTYDFFDFNINMKIPITLDAGQHLMRIFPVRSFGESIKGDKALAVRTFYVQSKKESPGIDANEPFLTYNEPQGDIKTVGDGPVLLDFLVSNCILSRDGYKVKVKIDNMERIISKLSPYFIYGLSKGTHEVELELQDRNGKRVPGTLNLVKRSFTIR